jgi:hypothetical protein
LRIPEAGIWAHITDVVERIANAWVAKGMIGVASIIEKSKMGNMTTQVNDLKGCLRRF